MVAPSTLVPQSHAPPQPFRKGFLSSTLILPKVADLTPKLRTVTPTLILEQGLHTKITLPGPPNLGSFPDMFPRWGPRWWLPQSPG